MNIDTKFNIGDTFYVARIYKKFITKTVIVDNEEYKKEAVKFCIVVKHKKIEKIIININSTDYVECNYMISNVGEKNSMHTFLNDNIVFDTYESAFEYAKNFHEKNPEIELYRT